MSSNAQFPGLPPVGTGGGKTSTKIPPPSDTDTGEAADTADPPTDPTTVVPEVGGTAGAAAPLSPVSSQLRGDEEYR